MPLDLRQLVDPAHTALVTQECQGGVLGPEPAMPALLEVARKGMIANAARLVRAARAASVPVVHCVAVRRPDGLGASRNARVFLGRRRSPVQLLEGTPPALPIPELGPEPGDLVLGRLHGVGPMGGTELAPVLRNLGATTIVGIGVSLNLGMVSFATDAVNQGFQFVMPRDAVCGAPEEYGEAMLEHTYALIATLPTTDQLIEIWKR
jgi:nicotinamidase-related amidase